MEFIDQKADRNGKAHSQNPGQSAEKADLSRGQMNDLKTLQHSEKTSANRRSIVQGKAEKEHQKERDGKTLLEITRDLFA